MHLIDKCDQCGAANVYAWNGRKICAACSRERQNDRKGIGRKNKKIPDFLRLPKGQCGDKDWVLDIKSLFIEDYKIAVGCVVCGDTRVEVLQLHHIKPVGIRNRVTISSMGWQNMLDEIAKCTVLCANCHRIWHYHND